MTKTTEKTKPAKRPTGLVALALSLSDSDESQPLKTLAAAVVSACDMPAVEMRRAVIEAVEALRDS